MNIPELIAHAKERIERVNYSQARNYGECADELDTTEVGDWIEALEALWAKNQEARALIQAHLDYTRSLKKQAHLDYAQNLKKFEVWLKETE